RAGRRRDLARYGSRCRRVRVGCGRSPRGPRPRPPCARGRSCPAGTRSAPIRDVPWAVPFLAAGAARAPPGRGRGELGDQPVAQERDGGILGGEVAAGEQRGDTVRGAPAGARRLLDRDAQPARGGGGGEQVLGGRQDGAPRALRLGVAGAGEGGGAGTHGPSVAPL